MVYSCLKIIVRIAIRIFCRKIIINKPAMLHEKGPLLLASNHPNSFLDGVIFDTLFEQPVNTLARGDVFKKKFYARILTSFKLLPVYRISEGAENLGINYATFAACKKIFLENGIVLMFSEGKCINEWHLRPLKKGTARLAISCWDEQIPLRVLPVGINYSSFRRFGKNIFINFGEPITKDQVSRNAQEGLRYQEFNTLLEKQLKNLVFEIPNDDLQARKNRLEIKPAIWKKVLLVIPAFAGFILHFPLYIPAKQFTLRSTFHNDHYDSVIQAILLLAYPFYILLVTGVVYFVSGNHWSFLLPLIFPLTAWCYVQVKPQLDKKSDENN